MAKHLLFVYGTLKKGHTRHKVIGDQRYLGTAVLKPNHKMIYLGGFPALVPALTGEGSKVRGELYEVDDNCLVEADKVEGVDHGLFKRDPLEIESHVPMMLPTQQTTFNKLEKGEVQGYVYAREYGNARDCGVFWF
jgi:gamma-glutamylcyclotransferase (GGCT)/AIG2-like uncharacterized protein YtfP